MALERCEVETWAEFGFIGTSCSPKLMVVSERDVFLCTGCDEIYVFSTRERKLMAVLQFPSPVNDLVQSHDKCNLYVACMCGVYCVDLQLLPSSGQCADTSCPTELKISSKFLVVPEEGPLSLLLVGTELVIISLKAPHWALTRYRSQKQTVTNSFEMLTSFSLASSSDDNEERTVKRRPVLICVHYSNKTLSSACSCPPETVNDDHVCIDPLLFKLLFGIDAALTESPVVLCGLPDGCLYFLPLRLPGCRPRALYSLEEPVIFVGTSSLDKSSPEHAQCLVAIGERGRVVLIRTGKGQQERGEGNNTACFLDRCLPGSLMCGCIVNNTLYYSIGSDLLKVDLRSESLGKEDTSKKTEALHQSSTSLNVCRIIAVAELSRSTAGGEVHLLGLSAGGQLQRITTRRRTEDAGSSKGPTAQVGRSVGDLLSAIGDVCERASVLKSAIKSKSQVLKHLNHVINISFLLTASAKIEEHSDRKPIRCRAVTEWSRLLQRDSLNLTCVLDNSSPYALEQGWTLSICVSSLSYPPSEGGHCSSTNYSFPFQNVNPGETLEVSLPLADAGEAFFPFMVSCSLNFSLSSLLGAEEANCPGLQNSCINLPLNTLWVDWLHSLRLNGPEDALKKDTAQRNNAAADSIQAFINSHQFRRRGADEGRGGALRPERYSASVQVSSELLKNTKGSKSSDLEGHAQSRCVSFLEWLLSEGCGGVRRGHTGDQISGPVLHARGPNGHAVKLTAKENQKSEVCPCGWVTDPVAGGTRNDFFSRECPQVTIKTGNAAG
ncbi:Fanconi anemia core complex-associated protein 100 isoform X2 [Takifugu flavidus]|uniref:Fanconi anemia core complex-associated protein 100 isoform X2 n=1 Tax=Takifugu flavidus TaxID=433684 RepID=UPI002544526B|nr:Fanconi anemia core complex-associated protein 100 isoform X2 [Takifugu flavidus]